MFPFDAAAMHPFMAQTAAFWAAATAPSVHHACSRCQVRWRAAPGVTCWVCGGPPGIPGVVQAYPGNGHTMTWANVNDDEEALATARLVRRLQESPDAATMVRGAW